MRKFRKLTQFLKKKPKIKKGGQKKGVNFPYIRKVIDPLSQAGLPLGQTRPMGGRVVTVGLWPKEQTDPRPVPTEEKIRRNKMQIKSITLGSYRRAKQCIAEIENQKDAKRHLKNELEKNNMIDQDAKETVKREIAFLGDNIERFKMELRRIEKNAFGLDWVGTFPEDDVIDANDYADMSEVKQKSISKKIYQNANDSKHLSI